MQIIQISRTISGNNFDNLSATAEITRRESLYDCATALDKQLKKALSAIQEGTHKPPEGAEDLLRELAHMDLGENTAFSQAYHMLMDKIIRARVILYGDPQAPGAPF